MEPYHTPVLLHESINALNIDPNGIYVDCTFGGGGHSKAILEHLGEKGRLVAFDQDSEAMANLPTNQAKVIFIQSNFKYLRSQLRAHGIEQVDGILADLGVSSHHFDDPSRGFSFRFDSRLDMRMNPQAHLSALEVIANYDHKQLLTIFRDYGELQMPHRIAGLIEAARNIKPITTTFELVEIVKKCTPKRDESKFLAKLFQAIRIEVNHEMDALKMMLEQSAKVLKPQTGRLAVITYHSLEDRLVKNFVKSGNFEGHVTSDLYGKPITSMAPIGKPITPSPKELEENGRSRSAKLRIGISTPIE